MDVVLIHIKPGTGPVGAWRAGDAGLESRYPDEHAEHEVTARAALAQRGNAVPWHVWFDQLADRTPYFDDYATVEVDDTIPLDVALARFTIGWIAAQRHHD